MRTTLAMIACAIGCTSTSSSGISTASLFVDYAVTCHADRMTAQATFHVGDGDTGTYVQLDDGDEIRCNDVPLARMSSIADQVWYQSDLPATATSFVFELRRASGTIETTVAAPTSIALVSPTTGSISASRPLAVVWAPSGGADPIAISLDVTSGGCTSSTIATALPDTGSATASLAPIATDCAAELVVTRSSEAAAGGAFEGGRLTTMSYDSASITIEP